MMTNDNQKDAQKLAREIMELSRNTLLVKLRFLEPALLNLNIVENPEIDYDTDGWNLYYGFLHVLRGYQLEKENIVHDYLHMVLHFLFHHPFVGKDIDQDIWNTSCDIAVENIIAELGILETNADRCEKQLILLGKWKQEVPVLTAERIYHYLKAEAPDPETLASMRDIFIVDSHELWYEHSEKAESSDEESLAGTNDRKDTENDSSDDNTSFEEGGEDDRNQSAESSADGTVGEEKNPEEQSPRPSSGETLKKWKNISARIQTDLETTNRRWADQSGSLLRNLKEVTRERTDYKAFLRQFSVLGEVQKINDSEFDYIYYTYGMHLYGNTPLVEPLEYMDDKRIREFAIVIDTSASVDGALVQAFLRKTWNILKEEDSFFRETDLKIILCDTEVKEVYTIRRPDDLEHFLQDVRLRGFGGTDFRPAFAYIDELIEKKEFTNLQGILYFTDGFGLFPETKPSYEAAFIFVEGDASDQDFEDVPLPPWAIRVILDKDDIRSPFHSAQY